MLAKSRFGQCGAIILALSLAACDNSEDTTAHTQTVRPVKLITVNAMAATQVNQFPAVIGVNRLSELSFPVAGTLREFPVKEAQQLERGDVIAKLDQQDFDSAVASAKAQYLNAEQEYQRSVRLFKQDAIARNVLEQRKTQYDVSKSQFDQAEKALADSVLRAPFKGVVAQTTAKRLQTLSPGEVVVKFMDAEKLEATIDLPASYLAQIPKGSDTSDRQAFVILDSAPNHLIKAEYKEASLLADAASQTYAITFSFHPPEMLLVLPGMNATVEVRFENKSQITRVSVPLEAVTSDGENIFAWVVDQSAMTVSKRAVTIEDSVGRMIVVTSGLEINDTIAGAGAAYLSEGMKIKEWK